MQTCSYCGKSNPDELAFCEECGVELSAKVEAPRKTNFVFFRWKIAAVFLWIETVLFALVSISSFWVAEQISRKPGLVTNPQKMFALNIRTGIANAFIALLSFAAWCLMRKKTKLTLMMGTLLTCLALITTFRRWIYWNVSGTDDPFWIEPFLVWLPFLYSIVYAYRTSKTITVESSQ
jgi:hypothetical protein